MAPRHTTQTDAIRELVEKIVEEKRKIEDSLELIREYSKQLNSLADETQQRLIGKG